MNKLDVKYKLVDTAGQITAVVFDGFKKNNLVSISQKLMEEDKRIEQAVFITKNKIQTMGNELCINGSLAGAYLLKDSRLKVSGIDKAINFTKTKKFISAEFPLNLVVNKKDRLILLQGIVYLITNDKTKVNKIFLSNLAQKYNVPASGIIKFKSNKIRPIVYVINTNTLVWENACGSGSLAYFLFSGFNKIEQPSGEVIKVNKIKKYFTIKVPVKIVS